MQLRKKILVSLISCVAIAFFAVCAINLFPMSRVHALTEQESQAVVARFTKIGDAAGEDGTDAYVDYVKDITYEDFTATNFSGSGVMVQTRNKAANLVDHTENSNATNPMLLNFAATRYPVGVTFDDVVDISDNTAKDTLIELAFPGTNNNWQARGFKIMIADASNPNVHIALYIWAAWGNTDATGGNPRAAAAGTWEKTTIGPDVYINDAGYDNGSKFTKVSNVDGGDGFIINDYTNINLSSTSKNTIKVQLDNSTGKLYVNGALIRSFKDVSANNNNLFPGFTDNKVKLSVGVVRTTRRSTDEFTRFCIMDIDSSIKLPDSGLIASGVSEIPAPVNFSALYGEAALESGFTVNITKPDNTVIKNYSDATFDFDMPGTYNIEYFVNGSSVGSVDFDAAVKDSDGELTAITSFTVSDNLFSSKKLSLADFTLTAGEVVSIESATVKIYKGEELIAEESADADWSYVLTAKGDYTFKVVNDSFSVKVSATVLAGLFPSEKIENGSVAINDAGDAVGLLAGENEFVITPNRGYKLASLTINGKDVTEEVVDGAYTFNVENAEDDITYSVVFEKLPTLTVTFTANGETVATISDLASGTLFGEIDAPEIPEKENYDAVGWDIEDDFVITENITAEAVYAIKTYTITFDTDGGSQIAAKSYTALETVEEFDEIPEKTGFVFDGWYLGTEKYVFGNKLTADITLTAKYNVKKITVTVKIAEFDDVVLTIDYNTAVSVDKVGEKDGYEFKGLFTDEALTKAYNGEKITEDTILYASYAKNPETKNSGCGANIFGSGLEIVLLVTFIAAICVVASRSRKTKQN